MRNRYNAGIIQNLPLIIMGALIGVCLVALLYISNKVDTIRTTQTVRASVTDANNQQTREDIKKILNILCTETESAQCTNQ